MPGKLYLVATPIGNLEDMTFRAVRVLKEADFIAAEDTRVTKKLLTHFGIHKPLISYYEHNAAFRTEAVISRILSGEICALVSDAGMPCVSDPGAALVSACHEAGIETDALPGASALTCALALSVVSSGRFCFEGFLTVSKRGRAERLRALSGELRAMVFFEAPHKLLRTLKDLLSCLGDRKITVCRELTKLHQEIIHTTLEEACVIFTLRAPKGEFVLIVEGAAAAEEAAEDPGEALEYARGLVARGVPIKEAAKEAKSPSLSRREIYKLLSEDSS